MGEGSYTKGGGRSSEPAMGPCPPCDSAPDLPVGLGCPSQGRASESESESESVVGIDRDQTRAMKHAHSDSGRHLGPANG